METVFRTTSSYRSINDRMTISPENPASFFSTAFISILWLCRSKHATISCLVVHYYMKIELYHENSPYILTSATKNRATTFPNWMVGNCIPVFLMAMHSEKWFIEDRIQMLNGFLWHRTSLPPIDISKTYWREKLGWTLGSAVAYTE